MERFSTWHSAVHAGCLVLQMLRGMDTGLEFSANLYDCGPDDGGCDAALLAELLKTESLRVDAVHTTPAVVRDMVLAALAQRHTLLIQVWSLGEHPITRWAVLLGTLISDIEFGICQGQHERAEWSHDMYDAATGEAVLIDHELPRFMPPVAAFIVAR